MNSSGDGALRWGLIGAGDIAEKRVAPALTATNGSTLLAVSRRRSGLAAVFAHRFGIPRVYDDWRGLLADAEVDAVYVATPVDLHAPITVAAAEAGKHVLCEKPMALTVAECDRMIAAAEAHGVKLGIAYYRRFYPLVRRLKDLLSSGALGKPVHVHIEAFERFDPPPGHPRAWLLDAARSGGGPMFDFGCHRLELLLDLLGPVTAVDAELSRATLQREVEDTAAALLRFQSGAIATIVVSHATAEPRDTLALYGSEGSAHVPVLNRDELQVVEEGVRRSESHPPHENLHAPLVESFVASVRRDTAVEVDGGVGREVNRLLAAIYERR